VPRAEAEMAIVALLIAKVDPEKPDGSELEQTFCSGSRNMRTSAIRAKGKTVLVDCRTTPSTVAIASNSERHCYGCVRTSHNGLRAAGSGE
jgi:hypothetical protein